MSCEHHKDPLRDTVAIGAEPSSALRAHLETCPSCRTVFTEEQQLFAAIHAGLRSVANAEPSLSFLPRVRHRLEERAISQRGWLFPRTVVAVSAAILIMTVTVWNRRVDLPVENPENNTIAQGVLPGESAPIKRGVTPRNSTSRGIRGQSWLRKSAELSPNEDKDSVLVPTGQEGAVNNLLASLRQGQIKPQELLRDRSENQLEGLLIFPLKVSPLEMQPLQEITAEN